MKAQEYLEQARTLQVRIDGRVEEIARMRARLDAGRLTGLCGVNRPGREGERAKAAARIAELEYMINGEIDQLVASQYKLRWQIGKVRDDRCRTLLELRYLTGLKWEEIAQRMCYDRSNVWRIHREALKAFETAALMGAA